MIGVMLTEGGQPGREAVTSGASHWLIRSVVSSSVG
jgi:hypothetical protein